MIPPSPEEDQEVGVGAGGDEVPSGTADCSFDRWDTSVNSVHQRWPGLGSAELYAKAMSEWMLPHSFTLAWYDEDGNKLLNRAAENDRDQEDILGCASVYHFVCPC
jgi:hypothetical protein